MSDTIIGALIATAASLASAALTFLFTYVIERRKARAQRQQNEAVALFHARISVYQKFDEQYILWCQSDRTQKDLDKVVLCAQSARMVASSLVGDILLDILISIMSDAAEDTTISSLITEFHRAANLELTNSDHQ